MLTRRTPKSEKRLGRHPVQSDFKDNAVSISEGKLQQKEYEKCRLAVEGISEAEIHRILGGRTA